MGKRLALILAIAGLTTALVTVASAQSQGGASPAGQQAAISSPTVVVTGVLKGVHILVVDGSDTIIAIWSNTSSAEPTLAVRIEHRNGPQHPLTEGILSQYQALTGDVDWTQRGLVYTNPS